MERLWGRLRLLEADVDADRTWAFVNGNDPRCMGAKKIDREAAALQ